MVYYPMYDFAHPLEDAFEGVTHSICTLEFEDHRPLYDWVVNECEFENPTKTDRICEVISDKCCYRKTLYQETGRRWNRRWMG